MVSIVFEESTLHCFTMYLSSVCVLVCCASSFTEENGSLEGSEALNVDDKLEIVSECWVEPVDGTVVNCTTELSHFTDCIYSRIQDVVCCCFNSISFVYVTFGLLYFLAVYKP